jgi:hypothetical protein
MSAERDVNRIVRSWLREDDHEAADAILGIVLSRLDTTPQRRSWWPARRSLQMNRLILLAGAAAAAIVVAIFSYKLLVPGSGGPGGHPTPVPSVSPTPIAVASFGLDTPVAGGRYAFQVGSPGDDRYFPIKLTIPAGWIPQQLDVDAVALGAADGLYLGFFSVQRVYLDPCHPEDGFAGGYLGTSNTDDLVNELRALAGFQPGAKSTVRIGDLQATHFVITNTIDTAAAGCTDGALLPLFMTLTANKNAELTTRTVKSPATNGGATQEVWIVDRGDLFPLLIVGETGQSAEAGRAAIDAIVASIVID